MNTANPYTPPRANVADVDTDAVYQPVKLWTSEGRVGRLRYLAYTASAYLVYALAMAVVGVISGALHAPQLVGVGTLILLIPYVLFIVLVGIQRAHDMDQSGWTLLLQLIPLVVLIWVFKPGSAGANRFGAPPPANTGTVKVLAFVFPVLMVTGILAAIALPAYQGYVKRARAAQAGSPLALPAGPDTAQTR